MEKPSVFHWIITVFRGHVKTDASRFAKPGREMLSVTTALVNVMISFGLFCLVIFWVIF